jgi:hypothetical protein
MDERELQELQDPVTWEADTDDRRPPVKSPRAVVSVAFSRDDLEQVASAARESGMRTSEFIRNAALAAATPAGEPPTGRITSISGAAGFRASYPATTSTSTTPESKVKGPPEDIFATV